jgi:hypothetical protein
MTGRKLGRIGTTISGSSSVILVTVARFSIDRPYLSQAKGIDKGFRLKWTKDQKDRIIASMIAYKVSSECLDVDAVLIEFM